MNTEPWVAGSSEPAVTKAKRIREGRRVLIAVVMLWCVLFGLSSGIPQYDWRSSGEGDYGSEVDIYYGHPVWCKRHAYSLNFDQGFDSGPGSFWTIYPRPLVLTLLWTAAPSLLLLGVWLRLRGQPLWRNRAPREEAWVYGVGGGWDVAEERTPSSSFGLDV
jgi:hypothetical protein